MPTLDVLEQWMGKGVVETSLKNGNIEIAPLALMRGRSFEDSSIIVDEAQNLTKGELITIMTRFGRNSKYIVCGDCMQSDIRQSGYKDVFDKLNDDD